MVHLPGKYSNLKVLKDMFKTTSHTTPSTKTYIAEPTHVTPEICFSCRHSYDDMEEGWNCLKYDAIIRLSGGGELRWPGQACEKAYTQCKGRGFQGYALPAIFRKHPFITGILGSAVLSCAMAACITSIVG